MSLRKLLQLFVSRDKKKENAPKFTVEITAREPDLQNYQRDRISEIRNLKKKSIPSKTGLYPDEILLLHYAQKYVVGQEKIQGFWYYQYGVDDVRFVLKSLIERGYLRHSSAKESVAVLKVAQLKEILSERGISSTGKKDELVYRVRQCASEEELSRHPDIQKTYVLTEQGNAELQQNEYVIYMHNNGSKYGMSVWDMNLLLDGYPKSLWRDRIWAHLNSRYDNAIKKIYGEGEGYAEIVAVRFSMCDFLIEENRDPQMSLRLWMEAAFFDINYAAPGAHKRQMDAYNLTQKYGAHDVPKPSLEEAYSYTGNIKNLKALCISMDISREGLNDRLIDYFKSPPLPQTVSAEQAVHMIMELI